VTLTISVVWVILVPHSIRQTEMCYADGHF
jgi:hypothetical protein